MTIKISKEFLDEKRGTSVIPLQDERLRELFQKTIIDTGKLQADYKWTKDNVLEIKGEAPMALHTFILEAEKHGLNVKYTKNTTIEIF